MSMNSSVPGSVNGEKRKAPTRSPSAYKLRSSGVSAVPSWQVLVAPPLCPGSFEALRPQFRGVVVAELGEQRIVGQADPGLVLGERERASRIETAEVEEA